GSFLLLRPTIAVVTNVEADHLDYYRAPERIERAFAAFCRGAETVVACWDDPGVRAVLAGRRGGLLTYGQSLDVDLRVEVMPTGLASVGEGARAEGGRVVAGFQPHRYSRTAAMWRELGESLAGADVVVITDVYAAWEEPIPGVTGKLVVDALAEAAPGKRVVYLPRRSDVGPHVASLARPGDRVVTLGAGDITMVAEIGRAHV